MTKGNSLSLIRVSLTFWTAKTTRAREPNFGEPSGVPQMCSKSILSVSSANGPFCAHKSGFCTQMSWYHLQCRKHNGWAKFLCPSCLVDQSVFWWAWAKIWYLRLCSVPGQLKMKVEGKGVLADMYRAIISNMDPTQSNSLSLDTTPCLPRANEPDFQNYKIIG